MKIRLRVRTSPTEAFEWEHTTPWFRIGRADDCQLVIRGEAAQLVSGRHAQIDLSPGGAVVTDLQSTNGTYVNGARLSRPTRLAHGDQVQLGQAGPRLEVLTLDLTAPAPVINFSAEAAPSAPEINASPAPSRTQMLLVHMQRRNQRSFAVVAVLGLVGIMAVAGVMSSRDWTPDGSPIGEKNAAVAVAGSNSTTPAVRGKKSGGSESTPPEESPKPLVSEPKSQIDVTPYERADFVMVNPTHYAIALEEFEDGRYRVVAKAEDAEAEIAIKAAFTARVRIIARDRDLSRRIYDEVNVGDELPKALAGKVSKFYCHQEFVPETDQFAIFQQLRGEDREKEPPWRAGFLLGEQESGITFRELLSPEEEQVPLLQMMPGTIRKVLGERDLRESGHVDFLEYALFKMCRALKSPKEERTHVHLVLSDVKFDVPADELDRAIEMYFEEWEHDVQEASTSVHLIDKLIGDAFRGVSRNNSKKKKQLIEKTHEELKRLQESLAGEIRGKLAGLRVPVLEREELDALSKERKLAIEEPDEFRKQRDEIDPERHNRAGYERMFCASHQLFAQIRWPHDGGEYELDLRLVDVHSGEVLASEQGDRFRGGGGGKPPPPSKPVCLPKEGEPAVLVFERAKPGGTAVKPANNAGALLRNALFLQSGGELKGDEVRGAAACVVHLLPQPSAKTVAFRDLFSAPACTVPHDAVKETKPVRSVADVPHGEELRYIVWWLARKTLPAAGKVLAVDGRILKTNLAPGDGLTVTDRLLVMRPGADGGPSGEIVACEPIVSQVDDDGCVAVIEGDGAGPVQVGDWVVVKRDGPPRVAVFPPEFLVDDASLVGKIAVMNKQQRRRLETTTLVHGKNVAGRLRAGLTRLGVPLSDGEQLAGLAARGVGARQPLNERALDALRRQAGATHAVFASISPTAASELCPRELRLIVVDVEHQQVVDNLQFKFSHTRLEALPEWEP